MMMAAANKSVERDRAYLAGTVVSAKNNHWGLSARPLTSPLGMNSFSFQGEIET